LLNLLLKSTIFETIRTFSAGGFGVGAVVAAVVGAETGWAGLAAGAVDVDPKPVEAAEDPKPVEAAEDPKPVEAAEDPNPAETGWNGFGTGLAGVEAAKGAWPPNPKAGFVGGSKWAGRCAAVVVVVAKAVDAAGFDGGCWPCSGGWALGRSMIPCLIPAGESWTAGFVTWKNQMH
jgi:hypothetical protein